MNFGEAIDEITRAASIDATEAQAGLWLNQRHKEAIARSLWRKAVVSLGAVGQTSYEIPENVVRVLAVKIGESENVYARWGPVSTFDYPGQAVDFAYAPEFDVNAGQFIRLASAELTEGTVTALVALQADELTTPAQRPQIPDDLYRGWIDGALSLGYARLEDGFTAAAYYEQRFEQMVDLLSKRANNRASKGPFRVGLIGV